MNGPEVPRIWNWRGPFTAFILVIAIVLLVRDLLPQVVTEFRLRKATELIAGDPEKALQALERGAAAGKVSERQRELGSQLARDAMTRLRGDRPLLRLVGRYPFDPASTKPYVTASNEMMLTFELPANLKAFGPMIRVSTAGQDLYGVQLSDDGTTGRGEVPLGRGGAVVADVDLICPVGAYGPITTPIARGLHLVQKSEGPALRLRAGDRVLELHEGEIARLQVARGTPLKVELVDELGLRDLQWSVDEMAYDPFDWSEDSGQSTRLAPLPENLTAQPSNRRSIELKASNSIALATRAVVELIVRDPDAAPIAHARVDRKELKDGSTIHAGEKSLTLVVTLAKGELAEDLLVIWDEHPQKVRASGQEVSALLGADLEGSRSLVLQSRDQVLIRAMVHFDWTPPTVTAILDPGRFARDLEVRKAMHEAPIGSIVSVTLADGMGLDRELVLWDFKGLEELIDPNAGDVVMPRSWTRRFRCAESGHAHVRVSGSDIAGNRTTIHEYRMRMADPMEERTLTLNGRPFPGTGVTYCSDTRLVVRTEGGIDVDGLGFFVLDPEQQNAPLGQAVLERGEQAKTRIGTVDLSFIATSARRVIGVLSRNERELVKGEIIIDFAPPVFRVVDLEYAGERDGLPRFFAQPGQRVSLSLTDDVGVDFSTISVLRGATIEGVTGASDISVVLALPAVFEEPVVLRAADEARNPVEFRFEVIPREETASRPESPPAPPVTRPAPPPRQTSDPGPPPPERPASIEELLGTPRIVHPLLGAFLLVRPPVDSPFPPFYIAEHELTVKDWRAFVAQLQSRGSLSGAREASRVGGMQALATEAARLLNRNTNVHKTNMQKRGEDEPLVGTTAELVKAYVMWANDVARDQGVWKVPTATQWKLAAGRALHPDATYPTTANFQNGGDLNDEGSGGALFGRDVLAAAEMPKRALQPGAFGLRGMPGSLYEWVIDPQGRLRLIGGSLVSSKEACRLDAPPKSGQEVEEYERGLRLVLLPRAR